MASKSKTGVWVPPHLEIQDGYALQALERGEATPEQQQRALRWIVEVACMAYQDTFDIDNERKSSHMQGRRFVGLAIIQAIKLNMQAVKKAREKNNDEQG